MVLVVCVGILKLEEHKSTSMTEESERKAVKTYVPSYQKEIWSDHADELDMSQSEFVRTMVQSGRQKFEFSAPDNNLDEDSNEPDLEAQVQQTLRQNGPLAWDRLIDEITDDFEQKVETSLESLQEDNKVRYSGKEGGYVLINE